MVSESKALILMDLYIECPVCEQRFSTPHGPPDQKVACPSCSRKFNLASASSVPPPIENAVPAGNYKPRLQVPATFDGPLAGSNENDLPDDQTEISTQPVKKKPILALQRKRRSRRRLITTLISSAILATVIGVLAGLLVRQLKQNAIASNGTSGTVFADSGDETATAGGQSLPIQTSDDQPAAKKSAIPVVKIEKPIPPEDIPPQTFAYLDRKESKARWNSVRPHLVGLKVFDGLGTHEAVGTIVDSRGWILTSYHAVKGASKIEVKASVSSIDDYWEAEPLTDLVRGYIAEQKEDDLVLLSINRRFIVAFSLVQPATRNNVVEGQYLLQCAPPSRSNLYGGTETKITQRGNFESLDPAGQSSARRRELNGEDLVWLVATGETPPLPGTPLFKIDGDLAAINVFSDKKQNYFLPVDQVKSLIAHAEGEVKPLRELGMSTGDEIPVSVPTSSDLYEPSTRLNRLAESCKVFNWIPQTREDYEIFCEFAEAYSIIEKYAREKAGSTVAAEKNILAQRDQLEKLIRQRATSFSPEDELRLTQMNKNFASRDLSEANRHVPFYGQVHSVDIVNAQLILQLVGTESYVKAPFNPTDDPMRMQTKWLFFGQTPKIARRVNYRISEKELVTAESVETLLNFGEQ
jgi:hypothetical protein